MFAVDEDPEPAIDASEPVCSALMRLSPLAELERRLDRGQDDNDNRQRTGRQGERLARVRVARLKDRARHYCRHQDEQKPEDVVQQSKMVARSEVRRSIALNLVREFFGRVDQCAVGHGLLLPVSSSSLLSRLHWRWRSA